MMICPAKNNVFFLAGFLVPALFVVLCVPRAASSDEEAESEMLKGKQSLVKHKNWAAGDYFMAAKLYADSPDLKRQALEAAADAYGKADQKYRQYSCLKELSEAFPGQIDFPANVKKQFEIGTAFARGHRDVVLSWLPWIKNENKSVEIYENVLKLAPFADFAPSLKLNLGKVYLETEQIPKALNTFRDVIRQHPGSPEDKYARFELANALVHLSTRGGDGDGVYALEAEEVLRQTLEKYPSDPETKWIRQSIQENEDIRAKRLYEIAEFYLSRKNPETAKRYFHDLMARYPASTQSKSAIEHLKKLEEDYEPPTEEMKRATIEYPIVQLPPEPRIILIAPQASGGKWLLPIEDLDPDGTHAEMEVKAKRESDREAAKLARSERARHVEEERARRKKLEDERRAKEGIDNPTGDSQDDKDQPELTPEQIEEKERIILDQALKEKNDAQ